MTALEEKIDGLASDVARFRLHCGHWYHVHQTRKTALLVLSALFTLCATITGLSGLKKEFEAVAGPLAASFSALNGAAITLLETFKCSDRAGYYGQGITTCDELTQKLKYKVKSETSFNAVLESFQALRK